MAIWFLRFQSVLREEKAMLFQNIWMSRVEITFPQFSNYGIVLLMCIFSTALGRRGAHMCAHAFTIVYIYIYYSVC